MKIQERDWQHLWSRLEDALGEAPAASLIEILEETYRSVLGADLPMAPAPSPPVDARSRHRLWRRLDEIIGADAAATLMLLLDESRRLRLETGD